ncbi:MAG: Crp/Fnr family transcriptional regulator [Chlorobi bacterium]|nr:Crp/Fnr family transcriptional regulator [Chlorobiota bacterium]
MNNIDLLKSKFGDIFENALLEELSRESIITPVLKGNKLIKRGMPFQYIVTLLNGTMKVSRTDEQGNEHILFYLMEGDSCVATYALCSNKANVSDIDMEAETDSMVLLIPRNKMDDFLKKYKTWREFVMTNLSEKIKEFLQTLDSITFMKLDERLKKYLKDKAKVLKTNDIHITHQDIANDLATSRVVISRLLKMLERDGHIRLHRNRVEILDL